MKLMLQLQWWGYISEQETMAGQALSNAFFMSSTTPKPVTELLFGTASFSLSMYVAGGVQQNWPISRFTTLQQS
jgi:hypothetical protein